MGFFPVDEKTIEYLTHDRPDAGGGRRVRDVFPRAGPVRHAEARRDRLHRRWSSSTWRRSTASLAGPKRPQDRIELPKIKARSTRCSRKPVAENGFAQSPDKLARRYPTHVAAAREPATLERRRSCAAGQRPAAQRRRDGRQPADAGPVRVQAPKPLDIGNGDVLIAAITSCTNTSNPGVLLAAGLLAKKAVEKGLTVKPHVKTSLAPGSRVVTEYLTQGRPAAVSREARLRRRRLRLHDLHRQRRDRSIRRSRKRSPRTTSSARAVLSGNRNFEARIHPNIKANFLASPPLVVAYAIAGTVLTWT